MLFLFTSLAVCCMIASTVGFVPVQLNIYQQTSATVATTSRLFLKSNDESLSVELSRRGFVAALGFLSFSKSQIVFGESEVPRKEKILVLGGTGFVGSLVVQTIKNMGIDVVATSRNGRDGTIAFDVTNDDIDKTIKRLATDVTAVISCIGAIGTDEDQVINGATGLAARAAKAVGVNRFVYITVAPEVQAIITDIDFLKAYSNGKKISREMVLSTFGEKNAVFIEPTFIYGGGSFELNPPRVATFYGKFIEDLLSSNPIRSVEGILPSGILKIALEPPVPVEAVASAAVAGALGKSDTILDSYDKIKRASQLL